MKPKEKAYELILAFYNVYEDLGKPRKLTAWVGAKQCAVIAVDQIINLPVFWDATRDAKPEGDEDFWVDVKDEINKL